MSALRARAEEYLAMRRALGFKLTTQGRRLMSFVRFCEERCADRVTADLAVEWATQTSRGSGDEVYQARRLDVVRIFARHLQALDPATEVPPEDVLSRRQRRVPPYLYSRQEIAALMSAAGRSRAGDAGGDLADADRPARRDRHAPGRGMPPRAADDVDLDDRDARDRDSKFGNYAEGGVMPSPVTAGVVCGNSAQDCSA